MHGHNIKYPQCNVGRKGNRLTPANLEPNLTKEDSIRTNGSSAFPFRFFNHDETFRYLKGAVRVHNIQAYIVASYSDEHLNRVHHSHTGGQV